MKNKEEFLKKLSATIDEIEDKGAEVTYFTMEFTNYYPDNQNNERKLCYFQADIDYTAENNHFTINDKSEPFVCSMRADDCTKRGYCNGDC